MTINANQLSLLAKILFVLFINELLNKNGNTCMNLTIIEFSNESQYNNQTEYNIEFNLTNSRMLDTNVTEVIQFNTSTTTFLSKIETKNSTITTSTNKAILDNSKNETDLFIIGNIATTAINIINDTNSTTENININDFDDTITFTKSDLVVNLINDHRLYFFILSFLILLLLIFTLLMMGFNYHLSKFNEKLNDKNLSRIRNKKNISFDIIDNGYRLNRNSARVLNRTDSIVSHIINEHKFETNFHNLNQTYERIENESNENIYELPYNNANTQRKIDYNEQKFQTFTAKKFANFKNNLLESNKLDVNNNNKTNENILPVMEYCVNAKLKSFSPTGEYRKSVNDRISITSDFYTNLNRNNRVSKDLIPISSEEYCSEDDESDYEEKQNISIDFNYRDTNRTKNNSTFQPTIISKCIESTGPVSMAYSSFNPKLLIPTSRISNFKDFQF